MQLRMQVEVSGKTETAVIHPLFAALRAAQDLINPHGPTLAWQGKTAEARQLFDLLVRHGKDTLLIEGLKSMAAWSVEDINLWLRQNGFPGLQLDPLPETPGARPFASASIFDKAVEWYVPGERGQIEYQRQQYSAFKLKRGLQFNSAPGHNHPIVQMHTRSGHEIYVTILDEHPGTGFDLLNVAHQLSQKKTWCQSSHEGVVVPMVRLKQTLRHEWLEGSHAKAGDGDDCILMQCIQETRLRMNHLGARAESAAAMSGLKMACMPKEPYVIDRPFLTWWEQEGVALPIFTAFVMPDAWIDPGDDLTAPF